MEQKWRRSVAPPTLCYDRLVPPTLTRRSQASSRRVGRGGAGSSGRAYYGALETSLERGGGGCLSNGAPSARMAAVYGETRRLLH